MSTNEDAYLITGTSSEFEEMYANNKGKHDPAPATLYRTKDPGNGYFSVGDFLQPSIGAPLGFVQTVKAISDENSKVPLLIAPSDYAFVWNDQGSRAPKDGSIWLPVAPQDYVSLGVVYQKGYDKPKISYYRCVHKSQVHAATVGSLRWSDVGSGANSDVSVYPIVGVPGICVAQANYRPWSGTAFAIKGY